MDTSQEIDLIANNEDSYWGRNKAIQFTLVRGRLPKTIKEIGTAFWNLDIFFGPIPMIKAILGLNLLIFWLVVIFFL